MQAAAKTELWQTLPRPAAMPTPVRSGYAPVDGVRYITPSMAMGRR